MPLRGWLEDRPAGEHAERESRLRVMLEATGAAASGAAVAVTVHNISASGMLLECGQPLAVNEALSVDLPGAPDCQAVVRWASGRLFGCQFDSPLPRGTLSAAQLRSAVPGDDEPLTTDLAVTGVPLGDRIRNLRKLRGLTLAELAKALNVSKPTVWAWEQGRAVPTPDRFEKIASVLGATAAALRTGIDTDAALALVEQSRRRIAEAYSVPVGQVRIMIEL